MTLEEAEVFFEAVLDADAWTYATDARRLAALKQSELIVANLNLVSYDAVPILRATAMIALSLLQGNDPEQMLMDSRLSGNSVGVLSQTYKSGETPLHIIAGVPSHTAWLMLVPYLKPTTSVRLERAD